MLRNTSRSVKTDLDFSRVFVYNQRYIILFSLVKSFFQHSDGAFRTGFLILFYMNLVRERRIMDYREFVCAVEEKLNQSMKGGVKAVFYTAVKNNGRERTGILFEKTGVNLSPTIYLEEFYECYQNGRDLDEIVHDIADFYEAVRKEESWDYTRILDFQYMESRIVFQLIHKEKNKMLLSQVPHICFLDLALVFYVLLETSEEGSAVMVVRNVHMEQWNVELPDLWTAAAANVTRLLPAEFLTMAHAVREILGGESAQNGERRGRQCSTDNLLSGECTETDSMYVLSNQMKHYGAASMMYPHVLEMIGDIVGEDYYILPSSVHEVIIVPESRSLPVGEMDAMVKDINETQVAEEDVLSDHAYFYERRNGTLRMACEDTGCAVRCEGMTGNPVRADAVLELI